MIVSSRDKRTRDFAAGKTGESALWNRTPGALEATALGDLAVLPGNRFEALMGDRKGQYSIRINDQ